AVLIQFGAALVAEAGAQVVLAAAGMAAVGQFAARHGHERPLGALDDLQVADDEGVVERDRAEGLEAFIVVFHELDADFGDNHSSSPLICGTFFGVDSLVLEGRVTPRRQSGGYAPALGITPNQINAGG